MTKILIVCPRLCHGGAERVAVCLANGFAKRGNYVMLMSNLKEEISYNIDKQVVLKDLITEDSNRIIKWLMAIRNVRHVCKMEKPDVIIGIMSTCSLISKIASIGLNVPIVATEHDAFERPRCAPFTFWQKFSKFQLNRLYKNITVLTEADKKVIGNNLHNVVVMPNPLAMEPVAEMPHKEKIILAAGRVDNWHYKGFDILIKAWGNIAYKYSDWKLVIAGVWKSQKTREFLDKIADDNKVKDGIEYLGFVDDMTSLYKKSSVFVLSSRYEAFGLVLIEAMSQGCAGVACDYNGRQSEIIIDKSQGLTCIPDDVDMLAKSIDKMLYDTEYRHEVQNNAIQRTLFYSIDNTINRWECLINNVIKK